MTDRFEPRDSEGPTMNQTETNFDAGTLSDADREAFLNACGLARATPERAAQIRAAWPDEDILAAMEMGAS